MTASSTSHHICPLRPAGGTECQTNNNGVPAEDSRAIQGLPTLTEDNNGWHRQQKACLRLIWPPSQQGSNSEGSEAASLEEGDNNRALIMRDHLRECVRRNLLQYSLHLNLQEERGGGDTDLLVKR